MFKQKYLVIASVGSNKRIERLVMPLSPKNNQTFPMLIIKQDNLL